MQKETKEKSTERKSIKQNEGRENKGGDLERETERVTMEGGGKVPRNASSHATMGIVGIVQHRISDSSAF